MKRRAIRGGGEQSEVEVSNQRWRGVIIGGGKQWQVEGSDCRWRSDKRWMGAMQVEETAAIHLQ